MERKAIGREEEKTKDKKKVEKDVTKRKTEKEQKGGREDVESEEREEYDE